MANHWMWIGMGWLLFAHHMLRRDGGGLCFCLLYFHLCLVCFQIVQTIIILVAFMWFRPPVFNHSECFSIEYTYTYIYHITWVVFYQVYHLAYDMLWVDRSQQMMGCFGTCIGHSSFVQGHCLSCCAQNFRLKDVGIVIEWQLVDVHATCKPFSADRTRWA